MELKIFLAINGISQYEFAQRCGIAYPTLNRICKKKRTPTLATAYRIHLASNKQVELESMISVKDRVQAEKDLKLKFFED